MNVSYIFTSGIRHFAKTSDTHIFTDLCDLIVQLVLHRHSTVIALCKKRFHIAASAVAIQCEIRKLLNKGDKFLIFSNKIRFGIHLNDSRFGIVGRECQ